MIYTSMSLYARNKYLTIFFGVWSLFNIFISMNVIDFIKQLLYLSTKTFFLFCVSASTNDTSPHHPKVWVGHPRGIIMFAIIIYLR